MEKVEDTARVEFRLSLKAKTKLLMLAKEQGGMSKLLRKWIEKENGGGGTSEFGGKGGKAADLHASSWHLSRIGNSLNQMAYTANKANLSGKVNDKLIKEMVKELMYLNIKINMLIEKS